jgi:AraC family transcriptional regulator
LYNSEREKAEVFMQSEYIARINQAINYIYAHLDCNLTVEDIANHCCFSKYYFNRLFKSITDQSIYSFIKRVKFEYAAFKLRTTRNPITEIGMEVGFSPSNFASGFKEFFGISPSEFRKHHVIPEKDTYRSVIDHINSLKKQVNAYDLINSRMMIKRIEAMNLEYKRFIGNYYQDLQKEWEKFLIEMGRKYPSSENAQFIGISYDDPLIADENRCIYDICIQVEKINCINTHKVAAGYYACYEFFDIRENLIKSFNEIFALWMPFCNYIVDERLCLEIYRSGLDEHGRLHLDICIPIKPIHCD